MTELYEHRVKRLAMRSMRRGMKEMDLILSSFADEHLKAMDDAELSLYDALLNEYDQDLHQWVIGQAPAPGEYTELIARIARQMDPTRSKS